MTMKPMPGDRVAAYVRFSTLDQKGDRQVAQITEHLKQLGVEPGRWFYDEGEKRHRAESRPDFQRLLREVEAGLWNWVVVDTQDRSGSKHSFEHNSFVNHLLNHHCHLWSVQDGWLSDPDDFGTIIKGEVNAIQSRAETKKKSRHIMAGRLTAARQGRYLGGNIPFAFDVAVFGGDGCEKWRVHLLESHLSEAVALTNGKKRRARVCSYLKVYPDGREEPFSTFPRYEENDVPMLVPTRDQSRLDAVILIFRQYAENAIAINAIATLLNRLKIKPMYGRRWQEIDIAMMLKDPRYVALPVYRKETASQWNDVKEGREVVTLPFSSNKQLPKRRLAVASWIPIKAVYDPIIPRDLWDTVQGKLALREPQKRAPRSCALWLKPFLVCGHCGKPMRGYDPKPPSRVRRSYFCGTRQDEGKDNATGCRWHRVEAADLEPLVERYLAETQRKIQVLKAMPANDVLGPLHGELGRVEAELRGTFGQMRAFVAAHLRDSDGWLANSDAEGEAGGLPVTVLYTRLYDRRRAELARLIEDKETDLDRRLEAYAGLPAAVRQQANGKLEELGREIAALREELIPLNDQLGTILQELERLDGDIGQAREAVAGDMNRKKAEALKKVVRQIVCRFRHTDGRGRRPADRLESVTFVPQAGNDSQETTYSLFEELWVVPPPH